MAQLVVAKFQTFGEASSDVPNHGSQYRDARGRPRGALGAGAGAARRGCLPRRRRLLRYPEAPVRSPRQRAGQIEPPDARHVRREVDRDDEPRQRHREGREAGQGGGRPVARGGPRAVPRVRKVTRGDQGGRRRRLGHERVRRAQADALRRGAALPRTRVEGASVPARAAGGQGHRHATHGDADVRGSQRKHHARRRRARGVPLTAHAMPRGRTRPRGSIIVRIGIFLLRRRRRRRCRRRRVLVRRGRRALVRRGRHPRHGPAQRPLRHPHGRRKQERDPPRRPLRRTRLVVRATRGGGDDTRQRGDANQAGRVTV